MKRTVFWFPEGSGRWSPALTVRGLGFHEVMRPILIDRPTGTHDYLLMHFHSPVKVFIEGSLQNFPAGTFWIWRPGDRHTFGNTEARWSHSWIHCSGSSIEATLTTSDLRFAEPIPLNDSEVTDRHLRTIKNEIGGHAQPDLLILQSIFIIWVQELQRASNPDGGEHRVPQRLAAVRTFIEENVHRPLTLKQMADCAHLSVSHFSGEFRRGFGVSPIEYVLRFRMQQALHFLRDLNLSVAEVAERVGFDDAFYFSKQFKKRCGVSPLTYRKRFFQRAEPHAGPVELPAP